MATVIATKTLADFANPDFSMFSEETLEHLCQKKDERIQNSVARKDPKQDFWEALSGDMENFKNYKVEDKTMLEIFRGLRD
jgi:hypothetical protein